jgi:hypothetical protein
MITHELVAITMEAKMVSQLLTEARRQMTRRRAKDQVGTAEIKRRNHAPKMSPSRRQREKSKHEKHVKKQKEKQKNSEIETEEQAKGELQGNRLHLAQQQVA